MTTPPTEQVIPEVNVAGRSGVTSVTGVGDGILTDYDDSTYVTLIPGGFTPWISVDLTGDYRGLGYTKVRVEIDAEVMGASTAALSWIFTAETSSDHISFGTDATDIHVTGRQLYTQEVTREVVYYNPDAWSVDYLLDRVSDYSANTSGGTPYHHAYGRLDGDSTNVDSVRIYGFRVIAYRTAGAPPLRQYPRSDGLGASSARRLWPPPRSVQRSSRRAGGYL